MVKLAGSCAHAVAPLRHVQGAQIIVLLSSSTHALPFTPYLHMVLPQRETPMKRRRGCQCDGALTIYLLADTAILLVMFLQERGFLSAKALQQLQPGAKKAAAGAAADPSTLPLEQQLPQIIKLLTSRPLVRPAQLVQQQLPMQHHSAPFPHAA
jgi:hypothetical protein